MGYESLSEVYLTKYNAGDAKFHLFLIIKQDSDECETMHANYFESVGLNATITEGRMLAQDPYQGDFIIYWYKNYVVGSINYSDEIIADKNLRRLIKNLN